MKRTTRTIGSTLRLATAVTAIAAIAAPTPLALAGPKGTDRPQHGSCDAVVTPIGGFGFPAEPLELRIDLVCQLRHLGRTTGVIFQEVTPTGPIGSDGVLPAHNDASIAYVAANGEVLYAEYSGPASLNFQTGEVLFSGVEVYAGGTGRFENASGQSALTGQASLFTNLGHYTTDGVLSY
jgi:hypothetical protein